MKSNKITVKITGFIEFPFSASLKDQLQRFCKFRTAEKVGDIETINHTQLGLLKTNTSISYEIC
jgi:hypothetical protein